MEIHHQTVQNSLRRAIPRPFDLHHQGQGIPSQGLPTQQQARLRLLLLALAARRPRGVPLRDLFTRKQQQ